MAKSPLQRTKINGGVDRLKRLKPPPPVYVGVVNGRVQVVSRRNKPAPNLSMGELAAIHEFGAPSVGIPARSFMRSTLRVQRKKLNAASARLIREYIKSKITHYRASGQLGQIAAQMIQKSFSTSGGSNNETWEENKPATVAEKGSDKPLMDTGALRQAITWEYVK